MNVRELGDILEQLRKIHAAGGAKAQEADFLRIIKLLEGHGDEQVADFVRATKELLASKDGKGGSATAEQLSVEGYVEALRAAGTDRNAFEFILGRLSGDRAMRKAEVTEIAKQYCGYSMSYKTRQKALDEISAKFNGDARFTARMAILDKITPW
jgi:hypothetical protein